MDDRCDVAIIALALAAATCLTIFFLEVAEPTRRMVVLLFPHF